MQLDQLKEDAAIKLERLRTVINPNAIYSTEQIAKAIVEASVAQMMVELHFDFGKIK